MVQYDTPLPRKSCNKHVSFLLQKYKLLFLVNKSVFWNISRQRYKYLYQYISIASFYDIIFTFL